MRNDFASSSRYYDVIQGVEYFARSAKFVAGLLNGRSVLELGCGTGLYLFPLKKAGFDIEGLDISKEMLDLAKKKGKAKLYQKDMSSFKLKKYDAILCLNTSLLYLPDMKAVEKTLKNVAKHLKPNGLFLLDIPNLSVEIKELNNQQDHDTFPLPNGELDVVFRDYKKNNRWCSTWIGHAKEGDKYYDFVEKYSELIYSPKVLEKLLRKDFHILDMFGTRFGGVFREGVSSRRFYLCKLHS